MPLRRKRRSRSPQTKTPPGGGSWRGRLIGLAVVVAIAGLAAWALRPAVLVAEVTIPSFSPQAQWGETLFVDNCAVCHGVNAAGTDKGPPLLHNYYHPGHHGDGAFYAAAKLGVLQHHWRFGNMPPQPQLGDAEIAAIVRYVRELQVANGIGGTPHR